MTTTGRIPRMPQLPFLVSRLFFLAGGIEMAGILLPNVFWLGSIVDLYSTLFVPIDGGSLGSSILLLILGAALARRKRIGWVVAVIGFSVVVLADIVTVVVLVVLVADGQIDFPELPTLARVGFNLASLGSLLACMIVYRHEFTARRQPGNIRRALLILGTGWLLTVVVALVLVQFFDSGLAGPRGRFAWIVQRIAGVLGEDVQIVPDVVEGPTGWINSTVGLLAALSVIAALTVLVRSQRRAALVGPADEARIAALVAESKEDSLAYFATRRDKSVVFADSGRAALLYRVDLGVCLASSDPIGPADHWPGAIAAWLRLVQTYGWTPAVLGASEEGARAYARAGLRVIRLGDEAILETKEFHLDGRDMRAVRQAVQRLERSGYRTRVRRHRDIPADEFATLIAKVNAWRDTETERGFSMALGRLGDPVDGDCLMVEAVFPAALAHDAPAGDVAAVLSFVPWGSDGFSLDVMRRHPQADNGVNELMVSGLMAAARDFGIRRVSLNFAVFRSAFEEGARIGAGPVLRLWRRLLLVASRWWQIESLFRSNVKYRPDWKPRFLCFAEARDIALVGLASGVAEGFIDVPRFLRARPADEAARQLGSGAAPLPVAGLAGGAGGAALEGSPGGSVGAAPAARVGSAAPAVDSPVPRPGVGGARVPEQVRLRMGVREALLQAGVDPYPPSFRPTHACADLRLGARASVAGRVLAVRDLGGIIFVKIRDWSGDTQLLLSAERTGKASMDAFRACLDLGDHVGAHGVTVLSRSQTLSLEVTSWRLTAKTLRPLPDKRRGLADPEARVRQRYLDLAINPSARTQLLARSRAIRAVRDCLHDKGFLEVETPILQTIHGGANARPFRTHINAYDLELYLRIAPELYLKRLMVGGVDRLFEIGRNFRNEGADATHNPEFTMLEAYQAYGDYTTMRGVARDIILAAARAATGGTVIRGLDHDGRQQEVDLGGSWPVVTVNDAISAALGEEVTADTSRDRLVRMARAQGIAVAERWSRGAIVLELYEHLVESRTVGPTFYADFPAEVSPLTRQHRVDPRLAERWDLVAFGAEIGTAYSELVDPIEQRSRLTVQSLQAAGGDPEAMELDEDFLTALEYAMPPSGGLGMGIDRLVMLLTASSIRETIAFPLVRPRHRRGGGGRG